MSIGEIATAPLSIEQDNDVLENFIQIFDKSLLKLLLADKTTKRNIVWAAKDYEAFGLGYEEFSEILPELITGEHSTIIQPRTTKSQNEKSGRTRGKAEVFTPSWICNKQNNLIDEHWFGRSNVFNLENATSWDVNTERISFKGVHKGWQKYVDAQRMEISCGEAPYLVSRYDTVTGEKIPLDSRIGLLDRKMRVVNENAETNMDWLAWSQRAIESIYGFEYQGDNLLLARENILYSYIEYYIARFKKEPDKMHLRKIALIISWNIWQMDGLKCVAPGSCHEELETQENLFEGIICHPCPGCLKNDVHRHNGAYCKIQDWRTKAPVRFIDVMKGRG